RATSPEPLYLDDLTVKAREAILEPAGFCGGGAAAGCSGPGGPARPALWPSHRGPGSAPRRLGRGRLAGGGAAGAGPADSDNPAFAHQRALVGCHSHRAGLRRPVSQWRGGVPLPHQLALPTIPQSLTLAVAALRAGPGPGHRLPVAEPGAAAG
nr:hypothetical protein [Tanacetum cinerariifolium]